MSFKNITCANKGWYFVRFKCSLHEEERKNYKLARTFEDWAFYDGKSWVVDDIEYFYVVDVINSESDKNQARN